MSISKYNNEGYPDPTAYDALSSIENEAHALRAFRPIVYICSPFAGDIEKNVAAARTYSRFAVEQGYIPIAPHLLFPQFLNDSDPKERELGLFFGNAIMSKCSEVWVFGKSYFFRYGSRNQTSQVEELPPALFHRESYGGLTHVRSKRKFKNSKGRN